MTRHDRPREHAQGRPHGHPHGHPHSSFDEAYDSTPPWDIGRAQSAIVTLEETGAIIGCVLDAGCGTGENALYLASRGHEVWGVDSSERAIAKARAKAQDRNIDSHFEVADALDPSGLDHAFDTVIDVGLFHSLDDAERLLWVASLAAVLKPGGRCFAITFSDKVQFSGGPRRIRREEFAETFSEGFRVASVEGATLDTREGLPEVPAWLATIERV